MKPFYLTHAIYPFLAFFFLFIIFYGFGFNLKLADMFFHWEGNRWALKNDWFMEDVLHVAGRKLTSLMYIIALLMFAATWISERLRPYRKGFGYVLVAVLLSTAIVAILKSITSLPCPWRVTRYGGRSPEEDFFAMFGGKHTHCFPAGHASGGYAWLALYFFARVYFPQLKYYGLTIGLVLGLVFGFAQQIRGAHFILHDLSTLFICWYSALLVYPWFFIRSGKEVRGI